MENNKKLFKENLQCSLVTFLFISQIQQLNQQQQPISSNKVTFLNLKFYLKNIK